MEASAGNHLVLPCSAPREPPGSSSEPAPAQPRRKAWTVPRCPPLWQPSGGFAVTGINSDREFLQGVPETQTLRKFSEGCCYFHAVARIFSGTQVHPRSKNKLLPQMQTLICTKGKQGEHREVQGRHLREMCFSAAQGKVPWQEPYFSVPMASLAHSQSFSPPALLLMQDKT